MPGSPRIEILYFEGCPNQVSTASLVERLVGELGVDAEIEHVEVPDENAAITLRFLGSPTVRVNGHDVEPGADDRTDFVFACRVYRRENGVFGDPHELWIRAALEASRS